jgi:phenylacetate-coenzyme A ligase PaaK-like adenylate-forming protein
MAVQEAGARLQGVSFLLGAEPLTPERKRAIEACGAQAVPTYGFSEGGSVGSQCPQAVRADEVHVSLDAFAVIQRVPEEANGVTARPILLTSLRPACPKILLNTEIGDSAVVERRRCGCLFDEMGYFQHVHTIRSSQKLTAEGTTILAGDLYPLLEQVLPRRFGGGAGDYQLVEEQNGAGLTRYGLLVSPKIGPIDQEGLVKDFYEELGNLQDHYRVMARIWAQANAVHVRRESPVASARGKVLPFQPRSTER